ncbi:hypothetical protein [Amnibacterium kyonggiense]
MGRGLDDHESGLPGRIADQIVEQTSRGVQLDVIVERDPTAPSALALLQALRPRRFDAVIVLLGDEAGHRPGVDQWRGAMVGLAKVLQQSTSDGAGLFVYDTSLAMHALGHGTAGIRAERHQRFVSVTEEICGLTDRLRFAELRLLVGAAAASSGRLAESTWVDWAELIVTRLRPALDRLQALGPSESPRHYRNRAQDERFRQRAVDALRLHRDDPDDELMRALHRVRSRYRTAHASLTIIDGDLQWFKASTEGPRTGARQQAFCDFAIRSDELTLINDTWLDPRTRANPLAQGADAIRFYAGFPVHSIDGYRIGMVCVYGPTPRTLRPSELDALRESASDVEQLLWTRFLKGERV